jgi:hypothetical protein
LVGTPDIPDPLEKPRAPDENPNARKSGYKKPDSDNPTMYGGMQVGIMHVIGLKKKAVCMESPSHKWRLHNLFEPSLPSVLAAGQKKYPLHLAVQAPFNAGNPDNVSCDRTYS